jgi:hypothetical protein
MVELAVAASAQSMDDPASRRQLDGSHTGIGSELVPGGEATDIAGVADE